MPTNKNRDLPNFLIIMSDEHGGEFSSAYGHPSIETPSMDRLAEEGVTFDAAYCNAPLSVPSRICFMTGQHNYNCKGWDNAVPMRSDAMTWPYLLRGRGYDVALSGKMHLVGRDNLHGFGRQLARDIHSKLVHPIDLWRDGVPTAAKSWPGVYEAGAGVPGQEGRGGSAPQEFQRQTIPTGPGRTLEIEVDDEAEQAAIAYLRDPDRKAQPFALCVGPIAPHFPFVVPEPYFSQYYPEKADLPDIPDGHLANLPVASQRLRNAFGFTGYTDEQVKRARAAYYGLISYLDNKIGNLLNTLEETGLAENTVVIYTSDHGDMLGEHGLWRKMCFYEESARIPMQVRWPGRLSGGRRIGGCASLVDLTATILDAAGISTDEQKTQWEVDGDSMLPLLEGRDAGWKDEVLSEQNAHGTDRPRAMLRQGKWKLCYNHGEPAEFELYDLEADPGEFNNLAGSPEHSEVQERLFKRLTGMWDGDKVRAEVMVSQEERVLIRSVAPDDGLF